MTVTATFNGETIAASDDTIVVDGNHYFPSADVQMRMLRPTWMRSLCFWKGLANYWSVEVGGVRAKNAAWGYRHPSPLARRVKGRVAFWGEVEVAAGPQAQPDRASTHSGG